MLQLTPQSRILLALAPVDFRNGIVSFRQPCVTPYGFLE